MRGSTMASSATRTTTGNGTVHGDAVGSTPGAGQPHAPSAETEPSMPGPALQPARCRPFGWISRTDGARVRQPVATRSVMGVRAIECGTTGRARSDFRLEREMSELLYEARCEGCDQPLGRRPRLWGRRGTRAGAWGDARNTIRPASDKSNAAPYRALRGELGR